MEGQPPLEIRSGPTSAGGYVEDRALADAKLDKLHHSLLADELMALIEGAGTPLHVAVYGRWGSGKSTLAALLRSKVSGHKSYRFVLFDAGKFAEAPLRRSFISQAAHQLDLPDSYSKSLYQRVRHSRLQTPKEGRGALLAIFLWTAAALLGLVFGVGLLEWLLGDKSFATVMSSVFSAAASQILLSAALIAAVLALMGKLITVDVEESEVSSEEEFERLFGDLVKKASRAPDSRLVFFIDELDRCSPQEVSSVLETIRTFLDMPGCVFIIAADQQALEVALTEAIRHAVPDDPTRPYYSSGAEYLDKIFQHQITIPPLSPQRLTAFALELVRDKDGVWKAATDLDTLISVLIPSHIRSPRRAKVLLNGFVTLFRLADSRHSVAGDTTPDPMERMLEFAKLSTLRLEFPLFYRVVEQHPQLARLLTEYAVSDKTWPPDALRQAEVYGLRQLVEDFASGRCPVANTLAEPNPAPRADDGAPDGLVEEDQPLTDDLLQYLKRTAHIPGPTADVIFLESAGRPFGIDNELASLIERAAVDNDRTAVRERLKSMTAADKASAVKMLLSVSHNLLVGIEADNAVAIALVLASKGDVDVSAVSTMAVDAVRGVQARHEVDVDWLPGAIRVALVTQSSQADALLMSLLKDERLRQSEHGDLAFEVVKVTGASPFAVLARLLPIIVGQPPCFITRLVDGEILAVSAWDALLTASAVKQLCGHWKQSTSDEDRKDFESLMSLTDAPEAGQLAWRLLEGLVAQDVTSFLSIFADCRPASAATEGHANAVVDALFACPREQWSRLSPLLDGAAQASGRRLGRLFGRLSEDLGARDAFDEHSTAAWEGLKLAWGEAGWPTEDPASELKLAGDPWGSGVMKARFQMVREMTGLDPGEEAPWHDALGEMYGRLLAEGSALSDEELQKTIEACGQDWARLPESRKAEIRDALDSGPASLRAQALVFWRAILSVSVRAGEFSSSSTEVIEGMSSGDAFDLALRRLWLRKAAIHEADLVRFVEELARHGSPLKAVATSLKIALDRVGPEAATTVLKRIMELRLGFDGPGTAALLTTGVDQRRLANYVAEEIVEASNQDEREYLLYAWRLWAPNDAGARRDLTRAFMVMIGRGKSHLQLGLSNLSLVQDPPAGMKTQLVATIRDCAKRYDLQRQAEGHLVALGLAKPKKRTLFGR